MVAGSGLIPARVLGMRAPIGRPLLLLWGVLVARAGAQTALPPEILGRLVGPGAAPSPSGLQLYGTDLGWTFEHQGQLVMLFGDTWATARSLCEGEPRNDDTVATLPLAHPPGVPPLTFVTRPEAPEQFAPIAVLRGAESLPMAYGQVPLAGFSDGTRALALLGRGQIVRCTRRSPRSAPACARREGLTCTQEVGECLPSVLEIPVLCDRATGAGCLPGTTCQPSPTGVCVDPTSSQNDGSRASLRFAVAHDQEIAIQDPAEASRFRSVARLATNKFINATARTVRCFTGRRCGSDYGSGHGAVLVWGRPLFTGEQGRQAQLYLMAHRLPLRPGRRGRLRPRYYAGVDPSGEPRWTRRQSEAAPLALDGVVGGSPHEEHPIVAQMAVSWIGAPVNKWVMLYGGDLADYLLADAANARPGPAPGAIRIRFADHPWGPWTPPAPHLRPGGPSVVGEPYGPGGVLFHTQCVDAGPAVCARTDPTRPPDFFLPGCPSFGALFDVGRFYGPNVIDAYTQVIGTSAADILWNVSTWNPYGVVVVRSRITPGPAAPPACTTDGAARGQRRPPFRWCTARRREGSDAQRR